MGIRERLVSAIITNEDTVHSMAVSVNKTLSHHLQKLLFFFGTQEKCFHAKKNFRNFEAEMGSYIAVNRVSVKNPFQDNPFKGTPQPIGMNIVVHPEVEKVKVLYQSLYYLYQHYQAISSKSKCHHGHATNLCQQNGLS